MTAITLPLSKHPAWEDAPVVAHSCARRATIKGPHVVIVDSDEKVRLALEELVESIGVDAACFGSTHELLARLLESGDVSTETIERIAELIET